MPPISKNLLFWSKVEAGKRWHVKDHTGKLVGYIRCNFNCWEGYVLTGRFWPDGERCVNFKGASTFWGARRAVERELRKADA